MICAASGALAADNKPAIGFLTPKAAANKPGPELRAAREVSVKEHGAAAIMVTGAGQFADEKGQPAALGDFHVIWYHQGDSRDTAPPIWEGRTLEALRKYVSEGGGLFLSGAAFAMVHGLRVEPADPRRGGPGNDGSAAGIIPVMPKHPIFEGLKLDGQQVRLTDRGYPAFADFHPSRGPSKGMLLARAAPNGRENPLAEYELGKGRIIIMGWRLPHYSHASNPHRANLERLTANIIRYLSSPKTWQKVVVKPIKAPRPKGQAWVEPTLSETHVASLRLAIEDLADRSDDRYPKGKEYLKRLDALKQAHNGLRGKKGEDAQKRLAALDEQFRTLRRDALLANPLLDFERLLAVKRSSNNLALPANWQSNSSLRHTGHDNAIMALSPLRRDGKLAELFRPDGGRFVGDVDLHWDADRVVFSMPGKNGRWQVCEAGIDGSGFRELPLIVEPDVDNYDACYLPDDNVIFTSTAPFVGVPCVKGSSHVSNLFRFDSKTGKIRQLAFDQDHDWCPTVMNNGRVLYLRWEYSDIPHYVSRMLFHCNPDGTGQMEYYGSNSYWPNSVFYARPIPNHPTGVVGVVSGHHDVRRMGELVLFDPAKGRHEADGVVQRIPGRGKKVEPIIRDGLVRGSWPKFLHPWPLSDKYFIVSCKPTRQSWWGIYLVDVFDNILLLREEPFYALMEPIPIVPRNRPPVIPRQVKPGRKDAIMYMADVYAGPGLRGVPRATVKKLRLYTYHFAYHGMGGQSNRVGLDGPWDVKRIIGTVPVEPDGSAYFRVPANVPIGMHPLDEEDKALQLMRSWTTAMPGEVQSCVGCHEPQNSSVMNHDTAALRKPPAAITAWYGPTRGFSFEREVQPVLAAHCVGCHNGKPRDDGKTIPDFTARPHVHPQARSQGYNRGTKFTPSYIALRSFVRSPSIESDMHLLMPCEYHADTTKLVQLLKKGHHGVQLDAEAWDRIITWIDLHAPAHGTWHEIVGEKKVMRYRDRRREMLRRYADRDEDPEAVFPVGYARARGQRSEVRGRQETPHRVGAEGWPFDVAEAERRQASGGAPITQSVQLAEGVKLDLVRIPAGELVMGSGDGYPDERPPTCAKIAEPFWMGTFEVTNEQFACFDATHDSRLESGDFLQFSIRERGYPVDGPKQPVCRVSWLKATAFCRWLSEKTGEAFTLPTEAQWEWACRAGTDTPLWYGGCDVDFAKLANLADHSLRHVDTFGFGLPSGAVPPWRPAIDTVNDGHRVSAPVGTFAANPWGLHDMHGNVAEWTNDVSRTSRNAARGGSWYDRPQRARSSWRIDYPPWQGVYDVGFRVVARR